MKNAYSSIPNTIWLIALISFISKSGSMVLVFLSIYLTQKCGFSVVLTGQILACYGLGEIAGSYLGGVLSDKVGFLKVQVSSLFIAGITYILLGYLHSSELISVALFFVGFTVAANRPATSANIAKFSSSEVRSRAYALNYQAMNLGFCIGPAIGGLLINTNYAWLFRIDGLASISSALALWLFFRSKTDTTTEAAKKSQSLTAPQSPWRNKHFISLVVFILLIGICFLLSNNIYPLYLKEVYHLSGASIGMILALNGLMIILLQMHIATFIKQFSPLRVIGIGGAIIALGYIILPIYSGLPYAILSIAIITIGEMVAMPTMFDYASHTAPAESRGKYLGLVSCALISAPYAITPSLGSYAYTVLGSTQFWIGIGLLGAFIWGGLELLNFTQQSRTITQHK